MILYQIPKCNYQNFKKVIINHFGVLNNNDDIDNDQDGHPIQQQSMVTKMAIMNRHHPATLIDSPNMIIMSPQLQHHNFQHHQQQQRNIVHVPPSFLICNQTSMNANIPPSSYHQVAATAASPQQIPISIPNSRSFDAATNEICDDSHTFNLYICTCNKLRCST
ncbi:hypothetical protein HUG17_10204 [Dermatophagoides farinae]|uniref:Uncharacterized protein n=1 Tax=Dermatophagoides farinae TaxID=6954 RepID=A0A9D4SB74_DERFA|nr:hypothetical protein HUG17_10204 [Dermatophagoides farinae]